MEAWSDLVVVGFTSTAIRKSKKKSVASRGLCRPVGRQAKVEMTQLGHGDLGMNDVEMRGDAPRGGAAPARPAKGDCAWRLLAAERRHRSAVGLLMLKVGGNRRSRS